MGSIMNNVKAGDNVTLSCEIYGYLQNSLDIIWNENNVRIDDDSDFTITIMAGNKLVQDGGPSPVPSIISQLNFTTTNMDQEQQTYSCVWREQAQFFFVTTGECYLYLVLGNFDGRVSTRILVLYFVNLAILLTLISIFGGCYNN